ncbi:MAG: histidine phosphatase family protein [Nocardia sp.]|nr:histidine phosphatase family protein [Nocardia sp.]
MVRTLILMRHGKSAYPPGVADHERPLAPRGRREAGLAGDWLRRTQPEIDAVRCSDAVRTRETLAATGISAPVEFDNAIYEATPRRLIEAIQLTDDQIGTLLLIGHSPGMPWTSWELAGNRDSTAAVELSEKFPTSALAVLEFDRPWSRVDPGTGELIRFHVPRAPKN